MEHGGRCCPAPTAMDVQQQLGQPGEDEGLAARDPATAVLAAERA